MVDIALVVPTFGRAEQLGGFLDSVERMHEQPEEFIVVAGDSASATAAQRHGVRVIQVANHNAAASRNAGWRASSATIVAFLDDDCRPGPDWLTAVRTAFRQSSLGETVASAAGPAAVGGPVLNPHPDRFLARVAQTWLDRRFPAGPADWLASQNLAVRRSVLVEVGGFDESLAAYEDVDLSLRTRHGGGVLLRDPAMAVDHLHRPRLRSLLVQHAGYGRGFVRMARKHPDWEQARRAPLGAAGSARFLAVAIGRPFRCAADMAGWADRLASLPVFVLREIAFLSGALSEALRWTS